MTEIVWIVARPYSGEAPEPIAWCTTPQLARQHAADFWLGAPDDPVTIDARRLDSADFEVSGVFSFGGGRDDAVAVGWLGPDGLVIEPVEVPPVVVPVPGAPSIWG